MSRRAHARRLNKRTAVTERGERLNIRTWLLKPQQPVTRIEAYALVREYHYAEKRRRLLRNPFARVGLALWLIVTAPIRVPLRIWRRRHEAAAAGADEASTSPPEGRSETT